MEHHEIGKRICKLRKIQNLTREELAEKAEISAKFLYEIEMGRKGLSAETLLKLANTLCCSCDYILLGDNIQMDDSDNVQYILKEFDYKQQVRVMEVLRLIHEMCIDKE